MNLLTFILPESSTFNMSYFMGSLRKEADSPTLSMDEAKARLLTKRVVKQLKKRG